MANEVGNKVADMVMDMEDKPGQTRADRDKPGMITQKCVEMGQIHNSMFLPFCWSWVGLVNLVCQVAVGWTVIGIP